MEEVVFELNAGLDIAMIEIALNRLRGVDRSLVDVEKHEIIVQYDDQKITSDQILDKLSKLTRG
jgi:copper chaperone CopZ